MSSCTSCATQPAAPLRAVRRGTLQQVVDPTTGAAPRVALAGCVVSKAPFVRDRKTYAVLELPVGDPEQAPQLRRLREVDAFVRAQEVRGQRPAYAALGSSSMVVKVVKVAGADSVLTNSAVDAVLRPGAFGAFGYCWLAELRPQGFEHV